MQQPPQHIGGAVRCSSCGAGVTVLPGASFATCHYCGQQTAVPPQIPAAHHLDRMAGAVGQMQGGMSSVERNTARMAAEMALPRLMAERQSLGHRWGYLTAETGSSKRLEDVFWMFGGIIGFTILTVMGFRIHFAVGCFFSVGVVAGPIAGMVWTHMRYRRNGGPHGPELRALEAHIRHLDTRIAEAYRTANS